MTDDQLKQLSDAAGKAGAGIIVFAAEPPPDDTPQFDYSDEQAARGMVRVREPELTPATTSTGLSIVLRHAADIAAEKRDPLWLDGLHKILEQQVIAMLVGKRGTLKSFLALHWAMTAAINGHGVVILSAEGAGLGKRIEAWMKRYAPTVNLRTLKVVALERGVNLNSAEVLEELRQSIEAAGFVPSIIVIDTLSKYARVDDENSNAQMADFLSKVSVALRDHYLCTVLLVAHEGHSAAGRPRGASSLMCNPDAEYVVERATPQTMAITVTRERFKDVEPMPPLAYDADVVNLGRVDRYGDPVTSLVLMPTDLKAMRATAAARAADAVLDQQRAFVDVLTRMLMEERPRSMSSSATWLLKMYPQMFVGKNGEPLSHQSVRKMLPGRIGAGVGTLADKIVVKEQDEGPGLIDFAEEPKP